MKKVLGEILKYAVVVIEIIKAILDNTKTKLKL